MLSTTWRRASAVAMAVIALGVSIGCGDDGNDSSASGSGGSPSSDVVAQAKKETAALDKPPSDIGVSAPLDGSVEGKRAVFVQCLAPVCVALGNFAKGAAKDLGVDLTTISAGATPDTIAKAFNTALAANPDVLISSTIPTALWARQLGEFAGKDIPVVVNATLAEPSKGVSAEFLTGEDAAAGGKVVANYVIAESDGTAKSVYIFTPEFKGLLPGVESYFKTMKACADCSAERLDVKSTDVGKGVPGRLVSYLQQHPEVKYAVAQYGDLLTGVPEALKGASLEGIKLISGAGGPVNHQYVKDGQQQADLGINLDANAYQIMDVAARLMLGQEATVPPTQYQWIEQDDVTFNPKDQPPYGIDYRAAFQELWGTSG